MRVHETASMHAQIISLTEMGSSLSHDCSEDETQQYTGFFFKS